MALGWSRSRSLSARSINRSVCALMLMWSCAFFSTSQRRSWRAMGSVARVRRLSFSGVRVGTVSPDLIPCGCAFVLHPSGAFLVSAPELGSISKQIPDASQRSIPSPARVCAAWSCEVWGLTRCVLGLGGVNDAAASPVALIPVLFVNCLAGFAVRADVVLVISSRVCLALSRTLSSSLSIASRAFPSFPVIRFASVVFSSGAASCFSSIRASSPFAPRT